MTVSPYSGKSYGSGKASKYSSSSSSNTTVTSNSTVPAYNAATGATTGKPSAEYDSYLKSLNKKGSANYVPTPDDVGYENMDEVNNAKALGAPVVNTDPTGQTPAVQPPNASVPGSNIVGAQYYDQKTGALNSLGESLKAGFQQSTTSGLPAPTTQGQANAQTQGSVPPSEPDMSPVDIAMQEDKGFQNWQTMVADYYSPENQKASLMDTYNKLFKKSGLDQLDEDIIDAKTVIEGTEDDIRNEIQQAGGFGSDSQVQALALSRNKTLLKNYNNLVAMREAKADNLNMMMSLAEKDRAYADQRFEGMLGAQMDYMQYRDKFKQNALDQYNKYDPGQLYEMLKNDPRQLSFAEQIMGVGKGGLQKAAAYVKPLTEMESLQLENQRLQNKKLRQDISMTGSPITGNSIGAITGPDGKPLKLTSTQVDSLTGFDNTLGGAQKAQALLQKGVKTGPLEKAKLSANKLFNRADKDQLSLEQTLAKIKADFMKSISGAAVSESEAKRLAKFLPEFGDQEGVLESKLENLISESQKSKTNFLRTLGAAGSSENVVVGPDGNEYEITN